MTFEASVKRVGCDICSYGMVIRGKRKNLGTTKHWIPGYEFLLSNQGDYSVWKTKPNGNVVMVEGWTVHAAIKPAKWNKMKVVAVGDSLAFYVNNQLLWSGTDGQLVVGDVGLGFYKDDSAKNRFMIDWATLETTPFADLPPDARTLVTGTPGTEAQMNGIDK